MKDLKNCRPVNGDPGEDRLEMDLMWSDPSDDHEGCRPSERGGNAFTFGPDVVEEVLDKLDIRAHQVVRNGYEFHAGRNV
ncbi:unnamed protein product [Caenorhabditis angaria]|uniref:Serine/threonine specific protein phosphatases domain-containing protein n=1 Tax=Caenorhabditis angaria TaxID=860376 RepID=A0A9P1IDI0_9PELO|nr:unnamed protein product [Caenorhabditis angaria]